MVSGPSAPGPALILERGRPVAITVVNQLSEPTAVHWHGIELESYYDGVVGWGRRGRKITPAIQPGHSFRVKFTPPRAGTFMYHTHLHDKVQLGAGLYGPIVVQEPGVTFDPATDHILLLSLGGEDALKDPLLMNGNSKPPALHWRAGKTHRIRLINISPANVLACSLLSASGALQWRPVAKDGADLPPNRAVLQDAKQVAFAGETYDFEVQPQAPGSWRLEVVAVNLPLKVVQPIEIQ
ncbi:MAG: multicopper oxidase domain-containing protein [Acidobacteriia bacterium]|nr:multicopper oxidase domain-containing protein [Terriglobia bacterium]